MNIPSEGFPRPKNQRQPTIRQRYKMAAAQGLLSAAADGTGFGKDYPNNNSNLAVASGLIADAMIAEDEAHEAKQ